MPLRIDRVDTEIEVLRKESSSSSAMSSGSGSEVLSSVRGRSELREKLRPIVMEILSDELTRMKRKVGAP
jgi:hypothetical protein